MPKKLLVVSEWFHPENFLVNELVAWWVAQGMEVQVLTQIPSYPFDSVYKGFTNVTTRGMELGADIVRFRTVLGYTASLSRKVLNYLYFMVRSAFYVTWSGGSYDALFVYHVGPLTQALPVVFMKLLYRKRTVIWTHDVWPDTVFAYGLPCKGGLAVLLKAFVRLVYRFCDTVCVSSPGFVGRLGSYLPRGKEVFFISPWVPEECIHEADPGIVLPAGPGKFIFTGAIGGLLGLDTVMEAFGSLDDGEADLYILGDGGKRGELEASAKAHRYGNIHFLGSLPQNRVLPCIRQCDFTVLPLGDSPYINCTVPAKFQTYLAAGKPILAVAGGEIRKLVERERIGTCAVPGMAKDIISAIRAMLRLTSDERLAMALRMGQLLVSRYDKETAIKQLTGFL